jgi:hypothetical protein
MRVYDLQGTIAQLNLSGQSVMEIVSQIPRGKVLYTPIGSFTVLSAQSPVGVIRTEVRKFIENKFPDCEDVRFVSGSTQQLINAKVQQLRNLQATEYTDNDIELLTEYKARLPDVRFYFIENNQRIELGRLA